MTTEMASQVAVLFLAAGRCETGRPPPQARVATLRNILSFIPHRFIQMLGNGSRWFSAYQSSGELRY
jgi:hypothetical protein